MEEFAFGIQESQDLRPGVESDQDPSQEFERSHQTITSGFEQDPQGARATDADPAPPFSLLRGLYSGDLVPGGPLL